MQAACEGQHKSQDVGADVVVENLAKIRHHHGMRDQFRVVVARRGRSLRCLQPTQLRRLQQQVATQPAKRRLRIDDLTRRRIGVLSENYTRFWHDFRQTFRPVAGRVRLRWQQDELE